MTPDFIPPMLWRPNSPNINPVDYKVWSVVQEKVYKKQIKDVDKLCSRILIAWDKLDQRVWYGSQTVVHQSAACVKVKGEYFEHKLSQ